MGYDLFTNVKTKTCLISTRYPIIYIMRFPKRGKSSNLMQLYPKILKENPDVTRATSASFPPTLHYWESIIVTEVVICHGACILRRQRFEGLGKGGLFDAMNCSLLCLMFDVTFLLCFGFLCIHVLWCLSVCVYWWFGVSAEKWIWCASFLNVSLDMCVRLYMCVRNGTCMCEC